MVDRAKFELILSDKVSASAKRQTAALGELSRAFTATSAAARAYVPPSLGATAGVVGRSRARAAAPSTAVFDANGRAARAVAKAQQRDEDERRRIGEGIARAAAKADREEAKAAQQRARERQKALNEQVRTADKIRRATEQAAAKVARADSAAERALLAMFRRGNTGRGAGITARLTAGVRDVGRQREGGGGGLFGAFTKAGLAVSAVQAVATAATRAAVAFGRMSFEAAGAYLSIASFRQDSITSLTTVMGNAAAARRSFQNALVIANQTPLDPQQVIGTMTQLAVGGFQERELAPLVAAASDIAAARGEAASDSLVRVVTQIRGLGRVTRGDITMQALSAGLNAGDIFGDIARQMNLGTGAAGLRAAERAVTKGRVNDTVAIAAFMASVRRRYDNGGALGTFARNSSNTLTGATSNLKGAVFTLLGSIDLARTPGIRAVTRAILALTSALDMGSRSGRQIRAIIVGIADTVGTGLFGGINSGNIEAAFGYFLPIAQGALGFFRMVVPLGRAFVGGLLPGLRAGLWPVMATIRSMNGAKAGVGIELLTIAFRGLGRGIGFVVGAGASLIAFGVGLVGVLSGPALFIASIPGMLAGAWASVAAWGTNAANSIIDGFSNGMIAGGERIVGAVRGAFGSAVEAARGVLGWHSPSRVFMAAGEAVAEGFGLGVDGSRGIARNAVSRLLSPSNLGGGALGAGAAGGGAAASITINIDGGGRSAREIASEAVDQLVQHFELIALHGATDLQGATR